MSWTSSTSSSNTNEGDSNYRRRTIQPRIGEYFSVSPSLSVESVYDPKLPQPEAFKENLQRKSTKKIINTSDQNRDSYLPPIHIRGADNLYFPRDTSSLFLNNFLANSSNVMSSTPTTSSSDCLFNNGFTSTLPEAPPSSFYTTPHKSEMSSVDSDVDILSARDPTLPVFDSSSYGVLDQLILSSEFSNTDYLNVETNKEKLSDRTRFNQEETNKLADQPLNNEAVLSSQEKIWTTKSEWYVNNVNPSKNFIPITSYKSDELFETNSGKFQPILSSDRVNITNNEFPFYKHVAQGQEVSITSQRTVEVIKRSSLNIGRIISNDTNIPIKIFNTVAQTQDVSIKSQKMQHFLETSSVNMRRITSGNKVNTLPSVETVSNTDRHSVPNNDTVYNRIQNQNVRLGEYVTTNNGFGRFLPNQTSAPSQNRSGLTNGVFLSSNNAFQNQGVSAMGSKMNDSLLDTPPITPSGEVLDLDSGIDIWSRATQFFTENGVPTLEEIVQEARKQSAANPLPSDLVEKFANDAMALADEEMRHYYSSDEAQIRKARLINNASFSSSDENESGGSRQCQCQFCKKPVQRSKSTADSRKKCPRREDEIFCPSQVTPYLVRQNPTSSLRTELQKMGYDNNSYEVPSTFSSVLEDQGLHLVNTWCSNENGSKCKYRCFICNFKTDNLIVLRDHLDKHKFK